MKYEQMRNGIGIENKMEALRWYRYGLYHTNQHLIGTGTVTDSGSVNTGFIRAISEYIYRTGKL